MSDEIQQYHDTIRKEINDIKSLLEQHSQIIINNQECKKISDKIRIKIQNLRHVLKSLKLETRLLKKKEDKTKVMNDIKLYQIEIDALERKSLFSGASSSAPSSKVSSLSGKEIVEDDVAVQEIHKMQAHTDTALDNTINMLKNTEDIGLTSLDELRRQGKHLEEINIDVDKLGDNVKKGNKSLSRLRNWNFMGRFRDKK